MLAVSIFAYAGKWYAQFVQTRKGHYYMNQRQITESTKKRIDRLRNSGTMSITGSHTNYALVRKGE